MARKQRIHFPGALYHVILRGNAGEPIFFDDRDRYRFYLIVQYAIEKFRCRIHAFCLMSNHLHLVLQVDDVPLSQIMQNISLRYTKWVNHTQARTGHLFQGRYKAILVDADVYLLELVRYVHLNPVRVNASAAPEDYQWSGHRSYLGSEPIPWLTTETVLAMLSPRIKTARKTYASFILAGLGEGRRVEFHSGTCGGRILGDDHFSDGILSKVQQKGKREYSLEEVIDTVCAHYQLTPGQLTAAGKVRPMTEARATAAAMVQLSAHLRLTDLATLLGRDISALAKAAQRVGTEAGRRELVIRLVDQLESVSQKCPHVKPDPMK